MTEKETRELYREITEVLKEKGLQITTMESCTSGQIASLITDTEGSSQVFKGAFVSYSNEVKAMFGVSAETIERYTVYSPEVSVEMARVCRERIGADIGIGITGTMGNIDPVNPEKSVPGLLYFTIDFEGTPHTFRRELAPEKTRLLYKLSAAAEVGEELMKLLGNH